MNDSASVNESATAETWIGQSGYTGPLGHIKVLDLTRARAGPTAVRILADWGADVIKIEAPDGREADMGDLRDGFDFQNLHRNKRSLTLNLKKPEARDIFLEMAKTADVIIENYRPGVKHRLGIDYEAVRAVNPRIVYGSISGFGQEGPYSNRAGLDMIAQGMGGLMSVTGLPGQGPVRVGIPIADLTSGLNLAIGVLTALLERERSGEGQWVHTSLLEAQIMMMDLQAARYLMDGTVPAQAGNNHPTSIPAGVFESSDGAIIIQASAQNLFERMCRTIGAPELIDDPAYATLTLRGENRDSLNEKIEARTRTRPTAAWIELMAEAGVPCGPIYSMDKVFADPQVKGLNMAPTVDHPRRGRIRIVGQAPNLSRTPQVMRNATPDKGEHTDGLLRTLGFKEADITRLRDDNAI